jgi:hypothetical protein
MTTEMIQAGSQGGQLAQSAYDNVDATLRFINEIGPVLWKSGAGGVKSDSEGKLMALACLTERKNPFEINRTYHLMDGKLTMRADAMLAELRSRGGSFRWIKTGDDEQEAVIHLEFGGNEIDSRYTMAQAQRAGLVKPRGGWEKNPANMLRARAISEGIRMIAPEIIAGTYTPEEVEDIREPQRPVRTTGEVKSRGEELRQMQAEEETTVEPVIDVEPEPKPAAVQPAEPKAETKPESAPTDVSTDAQAAIAKAEADGKIPDRFSVELQIHAILNQAGQDVAEFEAGLRQKSDKFKSIADLSDESAYKLLKNLQSSRANPK